MNPTSVLHFFFFLLPLTIAIQIQAQDKPTGTTDLITKACQPALYKNFCIDTLRAANGSQHSDINGLALTALNLAISNGTNTSRTINQLLNSTTDPVVEQCLTDCSENYIDAVDQLEDSVAALISKGYNDVSTWVAAAMSDAESCEQGFKDASSNAALLTQRNTVFNQLCSNVLAITKVLAEK